MATYELSSFGKNIVVNEGFNDLPTIRIIFIMITILFGLFLKFNESLVFWSLWLARKRSNIITILYVVYTCNSVIHTVHYADNIARPVDYYEPKYLYQKYILSAMEITFYVNFPILLIGYRAITRLLSALTKGEEDLIRKYCRLMIFYIIGSLLTLGHYRVEPPHSYTVWINFTILGEGISALFLAVVIIRISFLNHKQYFVDPSKDLTNLLNINEDNNSDDDDIETFNRNKVDRARRRSRSRTPTGSTEL